MDLPVHLVKLVSVDPKVFQVNPDHLVFLDVLETKDHKEILDCKVHLDLLACLARPAKLDQLELLENVVQWEKLVQWVLKAQQDLEANLEPLEPKEKEEKEAKPEAKVPKVIVVCSVFKVFLVLWVLKETKGLLVLPDPLVNLVNQVQEDLLVVMELLVPKVSWGHLVPVVVKVNLVKLVHLVLLVLLDLLDLLVNRWAMMLPLWLQSSDKAKPRVLIPWPVMIRLVYSLN